ncbi:MAG: RNA 2',3'-cyclic phosphodiesterase [Actinobacteria bacterium]|nr:MAG: RNA 2',3'-cyclic phosphodiesterase [Actinomycetota bacterium]
MTASGDGAPANSLRRGFLAVVPPPEVLDAVERRAAPVRNLRVGPRWTTRDQWHLTVQFLGAVPDVDLLGKAVADAVREMEPFAVQVGGGGGFPSERRCRVLWLGIHERTARLAELARRITGATGMLGYRVEERDYHAHLTLARVKSPDDLREVVAALGEEPVGPAWTVDAVVLFQSDVRRSGTIYTERARFPLLG